MAPDDPIQVPQQLYEIPTEDLITELCKRCSPAVFIGNKHEGGLEGRMTFFHYEGHPASCYGLCSELAFTISQEQMKKYIEDL